MTMEEYENKMQLFLNGAANTANKLLLDYGLHIDLKYRGKCLTKDDIIAEETVIATLKEQGDFFMSKKKNDFGFGSYKKNGETYMILPIVYEFSSMIISGKKKYEFRKELPKTPFSGAALCVTDSVDGPKITAEIEIDYANILHAPIGELIERTKDGAGVSADFLRGYFCGCNSGYAIPITSVEAKLYK